MGQPWVLVCLAVFLIVHGAECLGPRRGPFYMMGRPAHGLRPLFLHERHTLSLKADTEEGHETFWFDQKVDHFDSSPSNDRVFKQRYFYNGQYYKEGGPLILMLGGEGPEDGNWAYLEELAYFQWVKTFNAGVFDLEHRFYGKSRPFVNQTTENLKYLSSRQAIEDIADFIVAMNKQHNFVKPHWIVYGGSYSGALALWFREKHPELTLGAVGSSGPMLATLDFHEYLEDVEEAFQNYGNCPNRDAAIANMKDGFDQINQLIWTPEGRKTLSDTFTLKPQLNAMQLRHKEIQTFLFSIVGQFMGSVQYNRDNHGWHASKGGIPELCELMSSKAYPTNLERIAAVNKYMSEVNTGSFQYTDIDYDGMIQFYRDPTYDETGDNAAGRSWTWQTCTEFGYFQTTGYAKSIFGSEAPLNWFIDMCKDIFGEEYTAETIQESIHSSNMFYGGIDHFNTTNAVLIYGSIDPWHKLGFYGSIPTVAVYTIEGTAHCADMYPINEDTDVPQLNDVRKMIIANIKGWLDGAPQTVNNGVVKTVEEVQRPQLKPFVSTVREIKLTPAERETALRKTSGKLRSDLPFMTFGRPYHGLVAEPPGEEPSANDDVLVAGTIEQPVDQFDEHNLYTYQQRYWINKNYYKSGGPQFLMIEGESPANQKWITGTTNVTFMQAVKKFGAMAFQLEHRFYGNSRIDNSMSTDKLKYMNTKQALADIARFINKMNKDNNFVNPKWVTFGGSYPGALSAYFRQEYSNLSVGAIASSAGADLKLNYFEYLTVAERSLRHYSTVCVDNVGKAFSDMHQKSLTKEGRVQLSDIFNLSPKWTLDSVVKTVDVQYFFQNVYDKFQSAVQYNNDNTRKYMYGGGIKETCAIMKDESLGDEVHRVAEVYKYIVNFHGGNFTTVDNTYQNYVDMVKIDDYSDEEASSARGWMWQCCTELGLLQSTDGDSVFGSVAPIDFWLNFCEDVFGSQYLPVRDMYRLVDTAQKYHKGKDYYSATNVFFTSGKIDPWHPLAISKTRETDTMKIVLLTETAHCADMYPSRPEDVPELTEVRLQQFDNIAKWIGASPDTTIAPNSTTTKLPATTTTKSLPPTTSIAKTTPTSTKAKTGTTTTKIITSPTGDTSNATKSPGAEQTTKVSSHSGYYFAVSVSVLAALSKLVL